MESIITKLKRPEMQHMKLSRMHDIGGCRAIFPEFYSLAEFRKLRESELKKITAYVGSSDYIGSPKPDGYRGVHLIVHPVFKNPRYAIWNTRRIEIQIRTRLQHAWATTVESVDMFNSENLKVGRGDPKWRRFFALCSSVIALQEEAPIVPDTSRNEKELAREISQLATDLDPFLKMQGWKVALEAIDRVNVDRTPLESSRKKGGWKVALKAKFGLNAEGKVNVARNPTIALVTVDIEKMQVFMDTFSNDELETANDQYTFIEEQIRNGRKAHTFLVALNQMRDLRLAYPNLYANTEVFTYNITRFLRYNGY